MSFNGNLYSKAKDVITSQGDLRRGDASGNAERLAIGSNLQILQSNGSTESWVTAAGKIAPTLSFIVSLTAEDGDATVADDLAQIRMPFAFELSELPRAFCNTAPTGANLQFDIEEAGSTIFSTKLEIDATEKTSTTSTTPCVLSDTTLANDSIISFNCDQIGSSTAGAGIKLVLLGYQIV